MSTPDLTPISPATAGVLGRRRRLQTLADAKGGLRVVAVDHRDVLLRLMSPQRPDSVAAQDVTTFKLDVVRHTARLASAVILDLQYGVLPALEGRVVPGEVGLIVQVDNERPDRALHDTLRRARDGVALASVLGASAVKLFVAYALDEPPRAAQQEVFIRAVLDACGAVSLPLMLELVPRRSAATQAGTRDADGWPGLADVVARLSALGADVLKLQFPADPHSDADERAWHAACARITAASAVPWGLLSGGATFDVFARQLAVACAAGCSGFLAGRSLWAEAASATGEQRDRLFSDTVLPRLRTLCQIVDEGVGGGVIGPITSQSPTLAVRG